MRDKIYNVIKDLQRGNINHSDAVDELCDLHIVIETLLEKYIDHVSQCEGISFVNKCNKTYASDVVFTDDEIETLNRLD